MKLLRNQKKILERLDYMTRLMQLQNGLSNTIDVDNQIDIRHFPLKDVDDLKNFEENLKNKEEYEQFAFALKTIGGKDAPDTTRRILGKMISHNLSCTMNWSGRNNKPAFKDFKFTRRLITDCVLRNPLYNSTEKEVENCVKVWLRGAFDRDGGRNRRKEREEIREIESD